MSKHLWTPSNSTSNSTIDLSKTSYGSVVRFFRATLGILGLMKVCTFLKVLSELIILR